MSRTGQFEAGDGWERSARNRLGAALDRFAGPLAELAERDANDGDTRLLVADILSYGLNFSKYGELTTEHRTGGDSIDYAIVLDGALFAPVEVKRIGAELDPRNLQQARRLALGEGAEWLLLTNGRVWQVYHLRPDRSDRAPSTELILEADLMDEDPAAHPRNVDALFHVTREAIAHDRLDDLRKWREAMEPAPLAAVVQSDPVVDAVRAELRRITGHAGHAGDDDEIRAALTDQVIAPRLQS
ncbi:hypothetical protein [Nocardiopsis coralliicola]